MLHFMNTQFMTSNSAVFIYFLFLFIEKVGFASKCLIVFFYVYNLSDSTLIAILPILIDINTSYQCNTVRFIPTSSTSHFVYSHLVYSHFVYSHFVYCFYFSKLELNTFLNIIFYVSSLIKPIYINFQENNWHFVSNWWFWANNMSRRNESRRNGSRRSGSRRNGK